MKQFPEYIFSRLAKEVTQIEHTSGRKVLNLGPGSPDFPPSSHYLNKLSEFIHTPGSHLYPGYKSIPEFSQALINWYHTRFKVSLKENQILPLLGAKDAVSHLPFALLEPGDEILVPDPGYPAYIEPVKMIGAIPIPYDISLANFSLTPRTKAIWVNYPSNPTGLVVSLKELQKLVSFCKKHQLWLLYDNAYSEITFDGYIAPSILEVPGAVEVAVEIGSFSKTFSFAGFRMGWMVGNTDIISALSAVKSQFDSGLSLPLQKLGGFALSNFDQVWYKQMLDSYYVRRQIISQKLSQLGLVHDLPLGGLYLWAKIPDQFPDSYTYSTHLLHQKQVLVTPGSAFGKNGDRFIRASICSSINYLNDYL